MAEWTKIQAYPADRDRLNVLAAQLTKDGPGRFGQAETLRWLLDEREKLAADLTDAENQVDYLARGGSFK